MLQFGLLNEAGVAVLADIHFGPRVPNEGQHIRFSYAASNEAIEKGIARIHITITHYAGIAAAVAVAES